VLFRSIRKGHILYLYFLELNMWLSSINVWTDIEICLSVLIFSLPNKSIHVNSLADL
jgi:hypothetical protein